MSKGMQQRLGIAQALVGKPPLLLLDEPTSALDPVGRRTVRVLLEELHGRGTAVLLNSHLLSEIELVCDRVAILVPAALVAAGSPAELARARGVEIETGRASRLFAGARREDAPRLVRRAGRARATRLRRPRADLDARGRRTSRRSGELRECVLAIAGYALQEALRRKVFAVVLLLTLAFLGLYWLGRAQAFRRRRRSSGRRRRRRATFAGATCSGSRCSRRCSSASCSRCSSRSAPCGGRRARACSSRSSSARSAARTLLIARFLGAAAGLRRLRGRRLHGRDRDHRADRPLVARPPRRAGARARGRRCRSSPRSRCWVPCSSPRPRTGLRSSWSSAPGSSPACSARSARR